MGNRNRLNCFLGRHIWQACRCTSCGRKRDTGHEWVRSLGGDGCSCLHCGTLACERCEGAGWYWGPPLGVRGEFTKMRTDCPDCGGTGRRRTLDTTLNDGQGKSGGPDDVMRVGGPIFRVDPPPDLQRLEASCSLGFHTYVQVQNLLSFDEVCGNCGHRRTVSRGRL